MVNQTPGNTKAIRCSATEGAQQCLKEQHAKTINHTWGKRGSTGQWNADGTSKPSSDLPDRFQVIAPPAPDAEPAEGWGADQFGTDPATGNYYPAPPVGGYFNGDNTDRDVIATNGQPRPVAISGAPGSRLADVSSFSSTLTLFGVPVELQDELTWAQIAKHALDSMIEEMIRTRQPSDPALVAAALDAVFHIGKARGLA